MSRAGAATNRGGAFAKESAVSNEYTPTLSFDKVSSKWSYGCDDAINIPHPRGWILNGDVVTNLKCGQLMGMLVV